MYKESVYIYIYRDRERDPMGLKMPTFIETIPLNTIGGKKKRRNQRWGQNMVQRSFGLLI